MVSPIRTIRGTAILTLGVLAGAAWSSDSPITEPNSVQPARHEMAVELWPGEFDAGITSVQQQRQQVTEMAARLDEACQRADAPLDRFDALLAAANWTLCMEIEPIASRYLLGLAQPDEWHSAVAMVLSAGKRLDEARLIWDEVADSGDLNGSERRSRADALESLESFVHAFVALWGPQGADSDAHDTVLSDAARDLSVVLEDDRAEVAAAAQLWQAVIYAQRGRAKQSLDLLPSAVSPPGETVRYGFFIRLLRCRYTAEEYEGFSAAIALSARVEERCLHWFESPSEGRVAQRSAALIRRQITEAWGRTFRSAGQPDRAEWCDRAVEDIVSDYFDGGEPNHILGLGKAIPELVDIMHTLTAFPVHSPDSDGEESIHIADPDQEERE